MRVLMWPARRGQERNPYAPLLATALEARGVTVDEFSPLRALRGSYDVIHVHWPDAFFDITTSRVRSATSAVLRLAVLAAARRRGARLVWTVHNLGAHEARHRRIAQWYMRRFTAMTDGWTSLTEAATASIVQCHPRLAGKPGVVIPHPHYRDAYVATMDRATARARLGIDPDAPVALCFGQVRAYKGIAEALAAFAGVGGDAVLVVAGAVSDDAIRGDVERGAEALTCVHLHLGFVADDDVQVYLGACDLVVVPQAAGLNSGVALLAVGFGRPLLAVRGPAAAELARLVGDEWVSMFDPPLDAAAIRAALDEAVRRRGTRSPDLSMFEPGTVADATVAAYRRLREGG